jgi:hypothetical protein
MRINIRSDRSAAEPRKPIFIRKQRPEPASEFQRLLREAIDLHRKIDTLRASGGAKLSAHAFLRETLRCSMSATPARVKELRQKLDTDPSLENARSAMGRMVKELKGQNIKTPPTLDHWGRTERWLTKPRTTEVIGKLTAVGHSTVELFGVAVLVAAEQLKGGGIFGSADGTQKDIDGEIAALVKRYHETCSLLGTAWTAEDIDAGQYVNERTTPAVFKGTDVPVAPADTAGSRLVAYNLHRT